MKNPRSILLGLVAALSSFAVIAGPIPVESETWTGDEFWDSSAELSESLVPEPGTRFSVYSYFDEFKPTRESYARKQALSIATELADHWSGQPDAYRAAADFSMQMDVTADGFDGDFTSSYGSFSLQRFSKWSVDNHSTFTSMPEPGSLSLLGIGLLSLAILLRKTKT